MKSILAVTLIVGFVAAEVPSHSYLPPPPNRGYSSGPAVIAARTLDSHQPGDHNGEQHTPNGFSRSSQSTQAPGYSPQARYSDEPGYDQNAAGYTRSGLDDVNATVSYDADGFKPQTSYEDEGLARSSPGYDSNANNVRGNGYQDGGNGYQDGRSTTRGYN